MTPQVLPYFGDPSKSGNLQANSRFYNKAERQVEIGLFTGINLSVPESVFVPEIVNQSAPHFDATSLQ